MSEFSAGCTNSMQNKQFSPPTIDWKLLKSSFDVQILLSPTQNTAKDGTMQLAVEIMPVVNVIKHKTSKVSVC